MIFSRDFFVFLLVGLLNTLVGFSFYALFTYLGFHYTVAVFLATCFGVLFNFFSTGRMVFPKQEGKLFFFVLIYAFIYMLNIVFIKCYLLIGLSSYGAYVSSIPFVAVASFLLMKHFVFKVQVTTKRH